MKIPTTLPITAEQSRAARFQLGLTQANVIESSDLPGYKLKQFETGRFVPDIPFLEALRDFCASKGVQIDSPSPTKDKAARPPQHAVVARLAHGTMQSASMCLYISPNLAPQQMAQVFERMEANDDRISELLAAPVHQGLFGGLSDESEQAVRELFGAMAENYLLFRVLQGRNIVKEPSGKTDTQADLLAQFFAGSPAAALAVQSKPRSADQVVAEDAVEADNEEENAE